MLGSYRKARQLESRELGCDGKRHFSQQATLVSVVVDKCRQQDPARVG